MAKTFKEEETDTAETAGGVEGGEETAVLAGEETVVLEIGHGKKGWRVLMVVLIKSEKEKLKWLGVFVVY